ncbi:MAG: hypothetical protein HeimC2_04990 [Candidatus Heimdallarchaeota archaeon LC_2]|nr:MAG: hypothetical protein HeimC2_04990 [Candidatus Heimdallarchaeota archaeon LC_2]
MADISNIRITFNCPNSLKERLTKQADEEGIPRSQLIVEILENSLGTENQVESRNPAVNRLIFDIQKRLSNLEGWRREIHDWTENTEINTSNLEATLAELLNSQLTEDTKPRKAKKEKTIPIPRR